MPECITDGDPIFHRTLGILDDIPVPTGPRVPGGSLIQHFNHGKQLWKRRIEITGRPERDGSG